ncbi:uncharacterized protein LOC135940923 [Cloeon dipterum]|uniref:uncharacterized protein LOC135940923 n=1 Tax=Cloeon dipterum TaxID=197152 RepID=UPI00321F8A2C
MAEGSFAFWDGDPTKKARPCVLIIHYEFAQSDEDRSDDDKIDVQNIYSTLESVSHHIHEISASKENLLDFIGDEEQIKKTFKLQGEEAPDLFIVFIMTHGEDTGYLLACTEKGAEFFTVSEVCEQLKTNPILGNALKLLFVSACRGEIMEDVINSRVRKVSNSLPQRGMWSSELDASNPKNHNAVRVTTAPDSDNFVIMYSCVEGTYSLRDEGTLLVGSFCECFKKLERDVGLDEFLTRIKWYQHEGKTLKKGYGSTPEVKILKHRNLTLSQQCNENQGDFSYRWISNANVPLLTRKAHFYISTPSGEEKLPNALHKYFEFKIKHHENFEQLKSAVVDDSNIVNGCVLICVVAEQSRDRVNGEIYVEIDGKKMPAKKILNTLIHPATKNWIGKPKICIFLNTPPAISIAIDGAPATGQKYEICGTIHSGFLTIFLPQKDAVDLFLETLKDFTKQESEEQSATFQQFFFKLLQKATPANGIPPMIISTLHTILEMEFPSLIATESFKMTMPGQCWDVPLKILYQIICSGFQRIQRAVQISNETATDLSLDGKSSVSTGAKPISHVKKPEEDTSKEETEQADHIVYLVSADAGSGKSNLVERLASQAKRYRSVTHIDLMINTKFLKNFDWKKGYKAFVQEYREHIGKPRPFKSDEVVILDAIDALHGDSLENVLKMVRHLAEDKVDLWIFTRPERVDTIKTRLAGVCIVSVLEMNDLTKEKKIKILQSRGFKEGPIEYMLNKIEEAHADDLTSNIGILDKLATFPTLFSETKQVNVYELSAHVVELAIKSYLEKRKKDSAMWASHELRDKIKKNLTDLATAYFTGNPTEPAVNGNAFLQHFVAYPVVHVSGTLAAYLYISKGEIKSADQIEQLAIGSEKKIILKRMFEDENKNALYQEME